MGQQQSLFDKSAEERFAEYHRKNPLVFQLFERYAREALRRGKGRFGAKAVMERVRWEVYFDKKDDAPFKINNNWTARYVRLLEEKFPEFRGFFEKRKLRAA